MTYLKKIIVATLSFFLCSSFCYSSDELKDSFQIPRYGMFKSIAIGFLLFSDRTESARWWGGPITVEPFSWAKYRPTTRAPNTIFPTPPKDQQGLR